MASFYTSLEVDGDTITGEVDYVSYTSMDMYFDLYNSSFTEKTYPDHSLVKPNHYLPISVKYPNLELSDNDYPMLSDGREIAAIFKINGTVSGKVNGTSTYEDLDMDAGYKSANDFTETHGYDGAHYVPDDATTFTVTTIILSTGEVIREDSFTLDLTLDPQS